MTLNEKIIAHLDQCLRRDDAKGQSTINGLRTTGEVTAAIEGYRIGHIRKALNDLYRANHVIAYEGGHGA